MRAAGLVVLLLVAMSGRAAPAFDLGHLMQLLAATPSAQVPYVEKRYSALLSEPLVSTGTLVYRRPGVVEKNMATPREESFRIAGEELTVTRRGAQRRVLLSSEPLLAALAASLRGVLSGDAQLLGEHFRLALAGAQTDWQLELIPVDTEIARYVERIVVSGRDGQVARIEVREAGGDRSVLTTIPP